MSLFISYSLLAQEIPNYAEFQEIALITSMAANLENDEQLVIALDKKIPEDKCEADEEEPKIVKKKLQKNRHKRKTKYFILLSGYGPTRRYAADRCKYKS